MNTFAVYDDRENKVQGGFATQDCAVVWLAVNAPHFDVYDTDGEFVQECTSELEAELIVGQNDGYTFEARPTTEYVIAREL